MLPTMLMGKRITERANIPLLFVALVALTLLLRLPYAGNLFHDDGFWFTAAEEILRGKALYREIYFDKPPALPLLYAALFNLFGSHIIVIRLFTVIYSVLISVVLYCFASRFYDRRAGLLAAAMFAFFSTTSVNNHVQGLNTDFLMLLPYTAGAYWLTRSYFEQRSLLALIGGVSAGIAVQINPKGIFDIIFFVLLLLATIRLPGSRAMCDRPSFVSAIRLLALAVAGFVAGQLPFLAYIAAKHSLSDYWFFVWDWGSRYAGFYSGWLLVTRGLKLTLTYMARNNLLFFALVFVVINVIRRKLLKREPAQVSEGENRKEADDFSAQSYIAFDSAMLLWFAVSYLGLALGGRFYSNYFFQILPSLCIIGARGLMGIVSSLRSKPAIVRRSAVVLLITGFMITAFRFHTRTAVLTADWLRGTQSKMNAEWYHEELNREERMVAAVVRDLPGDLTGREDLRAGSPRERAAEGSPDYLFVWGSRNEIYYWSCLLPSSRYLIAQPLTGVPADVQHGESESRPVLDEAVTAEARAELVRNLEQTRPRYIVDEIGFFNPKLSMQTYPELKRFLKNYQSLGATGRFLIYRKKDQSN